MRKKVSIILSLSIILSILLMSISYADVTDNYVNPLMGGADPTIARAIDGYYYSCSSGDNNITLKRSATILGASTSKSRIVWKKPAEFGYVWGPYIYRLDGKWYIYFASGPETSFGYGHPSSYVLENASPDPFEGTWELKGISSNANEDGTITAKQGLLNTEGYGLACGVVTIKGERYFTYTKYYYFPDPNYPNDPTKYKFDECPTIVKMTNPWTLEGPECTLARPQFDWEKKGDNINEGAAVVERDGKIYFAYSASSFMNDNYCVGVSVADATSNIMDPASWSKYEQPILKRSNENSSYGPGSPLFLKSEDGTEDLIVYHGIPTHGQGGGNRGIRVQQINWNDDGFINPGIASNPGTVLTRPSGEEKSEIYEAEEAELSGVSKVSGNSAYASGAQYVKYNNSSDEDYIEFKVNTNSAGTYSLDFRYNNNTPTTGPAITMKLGVNQGVSSDISFAPNPGSDVNFDIASVYNVQLSAGVNTIRLSGKSTLTVDAMTIKRSVLYEAEDAYKFGNAKLDSDHTGFSGSGFVGGLWMSESGVSFDVNAANTGNYTVKLRYCLGFSDYDRNLSMYVNGVKIKNVNFSFLSDWNKWADRYDNVTLKEGLNTITYQYDEGNTGNINLDYIAVTEATTMNYEAENAKTTGVRDAKVVYANSGNTGTGYVSGLTQTGSSVEYSVNVENAASYDVKLRYASDTDKTLALYLNGTQVENIVLPSTGGSTVWKEKLVTLNLKEGKNTITYKCETANSGIINIDNIHLNKRTPWRYQAEEATHTGNLRVVQDHLWYEGTGFVGGFEQDGDSIKFTVNVPNTASYTETLRYCGAHTSNITMSMYVNDEFIKQVILPPTANWDSWNDATEAVNLKAGNNVIEFIRDVGDTGRFNVDSLTIDKFSGGYMSSIAKKVVPEKLVKIQPKHSGKSLDVDRVSSDPGAVINQWANTDGNNQLWRFFDLGNGYYQIQSSQSGRLIDILAGSEIQQICQNQKIGEDGYITDTNQWRLEKVGDYYKIINKSNGKVITVEESTNNGAKVMVADYEGKDNQLMKIEVRNLSDSEFHAVSDITNVPASVKVGENLTLFGTVSPDNATRKSIAWSVKDAGTTGATLDSNILSASKSGTVVVTATIEEGSAVGTAYSKDFTVNVINDNPEITPESANYDLTAPGDVSTKIKWNLASSVTDVLYGDNSLTGPAITVTTEGALTIKSDYLAGLGLANGNKAEFVINFDKGNPVTFTVNIFDSSLYSITVENDNNGTASANYTFAAEDTEVTLNAIPKDGYRFKEWQVTSPAGIAITGNTFTMPNGAVTIKAIFEENPVTNHTVTVNGSYALESGMGSYAEGTTVTINAGNRSNYTFRGWSSTDGVSFANTNSNTTTFTMPAKNVAVTALWNYNGGTTDEGGNNTPPTPDTEKYNADIKVPDASGNTTLPITVDEKTSTAVLDTTSKSNLISNGGISVITIPSIPVVDTYTVGIPVSNLTTSDMKGALKVSTKNGSIIIPSNMLTDTTGVTGKKVEITIGQVDKTRLTESAKKAIGDRPIIQLFMSIDGKPYEWNNPEKPVTVTIPYTPTASELANPEGITVWYIKDSGKAELVPNGHYDPATGTVTFTTTHFSYYAVGYNAVNFKDVAVNVWYNKAVNFIAARGIAAGTGNGNYSPNARLTRGEFLVMLMKAYNIAPDAEQSNNFTDAGNAYYTGYLAAAKRLGISEGVGNNMFAPSKKITRQEMFTLLYNVLKDIGKLPQGSSGKSLSSFSDVEQIASWAKDAMTLLVETGTVGGSGGQLTPKSTTTRAEMAQVLYNLLSK